MEALCVILDLRFSGCIPGPRHEFYFEIKFIVKLAPGLFRHQHQIFSAGNTRQQFYRPVLPARMC